MVTSGDENKVIEILEGAGKNNKRRSIAEFFEDFIDPDISDFKNYANDFSEVSMKDICRSYKIRTEGELIKKALEFTNWNRKKTAKMLSISYKSLLNKMKACELERG
jgi:DNA-binding NtrC family response regulator